MVPLNSGTCLMLPAASVPSSTSSGSLCGGRAPSDIACQDGGSNPMTHSRLASAAARKNVVPPIGPPTGQPRWGGVGGSWPDCHPNLLNKQACSFSRHSSTQCLPTPRAMNQNSLLLQHQSIESARWPPDIATLRRERYRTRAHWLNHPDQIVCQADAQCKRSNHTACTSWSGILSSSVWCSRAVRSMCARTRSG